MKANCHYQELFLPAGGTAELQIPNAAFLRCVAADGRKFLLSIDGEDPVPCWGGWHWKTHDKPIQRLFLKSLPDEARDLTVGFFFGEGDHRLSAMSMTQHFRADHIPEEKIPNKFFPVRFMWDQPDDSIIRRLGPDDFLYGFEFWEGQPQEAVLSLAGPFEKFGVSFLTNDASHPVSLSYRIPGTEFPEPGFPISLGGETFMMNSSQDVALFWDFLDVPAVWEPRFAFSMWRSNPLFESFAFNVDSVLFQFEYETWLAGHEQPETAWFMNGEEVPRPEWLGCGSRGLRHTRASWLGMPGWDIPRQTLFRIREYYESVGGHAPVTLELRARRNVSRPTVPVSILVQVERYSNSTWTMPRVETPDHFYLISGTPAGENLMAYDIPTEWRSILEFTFDPATGNGSVLWK